MPILLKRPIIYVIIDDKKTKSSNQLTGLTTLKITHKQDFSVFIIIRNKTISLTEKNNYESKDILTPTLLSILKF